MAFPKHPIIDVTPVDAARGSAATAQAAAEPSSRRPRSASASERWITGRCTPRSSTVAAIPFAIKAMLPLPHRV